MSTLNDFTTTMRSCPALPNQNSLFLSLPENPISYIAHFLNNGLIFSDGILVALKLKSGYYYAHACHFA
jgi:hypothetical protein